jgi:hypothetical protein
MPAIKKVSEKVPEQFGNAMIKAVREFAHNEIPDTVDLDENWFEHVKNVDTRNAICETYYGARWLYRIGLALLVSDIERFAHVRAQIIDYGSICEALLAEMIVHGLTIGIMTGTQYQYISATHIQKNKITFHTYRGGVAKQTFWWCIAVAKEESIIDEYLEKELIKLRDMRNTVHLTEKIKAQKINKRDYTLGESAVALKTLEKTIYQTKSWFAKHPAP